MYMTLVIISFHVMVIVAWTWSGCKVELIANRCENGWNLRLWIWLWQGQDGERWEAEDNDDHLDADEEDDDDGNNGEDCEDNDDDEADAEDWWCVVTKALNRYPKIDLIR